MKTNYSISIPKPCHEDWSKMTPNKKGRFCQSCSKTVVDFTGMKVDEIQDYIHHNKNQRICGHIKQSQLDVINLRIPETVFNQNWNFNRLFLLALLLAMGTTLLNCSDEKGNTKRIENIEIIEHINDSSSVKANPPINTIPKIKTVDNSKIKAPKAPIPSIPIILGDMIVLDGIIEITPHLNKRPYTYNIVDEKPRFINTPTNLSQNEEKKYFYKEINNLIEENFKIKQGNTGLNGRQRIYCQLEINESGNIENLKIRAPHPFYEDEVKRVFNLFPKFIPAKHKGENVSVIFSLPIAFVVED